MRYFSVESCPGRVELTGEIDLSAVEELRSALDRASARGDEVLEVDVGDVTFMDSSGINELVRLGAGGHRIVIEDASPFVRRTLEMMGLGEAFDLRPDHSSAR